MEEFEDKRQEEFLEEEEGEDFIEQIKTFIDNGNDEELLSYLSSTHPADTAETMTALDDDDAALYLLRLCSYEDQAHVLIELNEDLLSSILENLNLKELAEIFQFLESDDIIYLVSQLPSEKGEQALNTISTREAFRLRKQLKYEEYTAGRLMSNEFATARETDTVRKGILSLRRVAKNDHDIFLLFVTDQEGVVRGYVGLKDLFFSNPRAKIQEIMKTSIKTVHYSMKQEEVARFFQKYDYVSAAVVDDEERMIGRITVDDVLDVMQQEASEDIYKMAGLSEDERIYAPVWDTVKTRIPWLHLNLLTAVLASSVVTFFESTIGRVVALASLMPIVAGMGGNAGTQSITVVVRSIATGELGDRNWKQAIFRELLIGLFNGIILGFVTAFFVYFFKHNLALAIVIGLAMLINLLIAGLVGSSIPIILKYFDIDPAIASSIFVTTFTDIFGFFCFLGLASLFITYLV